MSAAVADAVETAAPANKKKLSKKLVLILALAVVLLAGGGGAALFVMKKRAAHAEAEAVDGEEGAAAEHGEAGTALRKPDPKHPPTFLPLEPFVVNLADRDSDRYAQIGITLQVDDAKVAEQLKLYMPAIRNGVLMILSHKSSAELLERSGKERLAAEIMREAVRPLGIEVELEPPATADEAASGAAAPAPKKKKKPKVAEEEHNPVEFVHFSSFIIQ